MASERDRDNATAIVTVIDRSGKETIKHELLSRLPLDLPTDERSLARLGTSRGVTLNMGNYESVKIDVWLTVPCHVAMAGEAYEFVADWCENRVRDEIKKVRGTKL